MSGNILFLGNKIFEIPPFFEARPGDLGKKVHACLLRFSALKYATRIRIHSSTTDSSGNIGKRACLVKTGKREPGNEVAILNTAFKAKKWARSCYVTG